MAYLEDRRYGLITPENRDTKIRTLDHQQVSGYSVGIVYIENVNYPLIPGNVVNAYTYDFPVRMAPVKNLTNDRLFNADPTIKDDIIEAAQHMVKYDGVRAICSACGFFGNYHKDVAAAVDVPVAMSSLVQIPWIRTLLKPGQKIAILTANGASLNENLLAQCGVENTKNLVWKGFENTKEFIWMKNNSYKYGFILRYPKAKFHITGFKYEPWHYRYVGIKAAKIIHDNNITLEEYKKKTD